MKTPPGASPDVRDVRKHRVRPAPETGESGARELVATPARREMVVHDRTRLIDGPHHHAAQPQGWAACFENGRRHPSAALPES